MSETNSDAIPSGRHSRVCEQRLGPATHSAEIDMTGPFSALGQSSAGSAGECSELEFQLDDPLR